MYMHISPDTGNLNIMGELLLKKDLISELATTEKGQNKYKCNAMDF